jgi:response regulator RpfG family c-di-GMP phosphodiesterase
MIKICLKPERLVLVVDDQAGIRRLIADVLKEDGYRVLHGRGRGSGSWSFWRIALPI